MTNQSDFCECAMCGFKWRQGQDGDHSCARILRTRVVELKAWKESAQAVLDEIDLQAIGKELGVKLGDPIGPAILPGIRAIKACTVFQSTRGL